MITDVRGRVFSFASPPKRAVSLVPSLTETLFELGAGADVAGITDFCIFPEGLDLPRVGGTKTPQIDAIRALEPDIVYMNLEENLERHAVAIEEFAPVFATEPKQVDDVAALFNTLAAIHRRDAAPLLLALDAARALPKRSFTFAVAIWKQPWMWCGGDTYVSDLITCAGGINVLADRRRYPTVPLEEMRRMGPDIVFLPDEPYAFTAADAGSIDWARVIGPFPGHLFTWHGSRTIRGLQFLAETLA